MKSVDLALIAAGAGTYLLRYLPMAGSRFLVRLPDTSPLYRVLQAMGPAAITSLAVVCLVALPAGHGWSPVSLAAVMAGVLSVFAVHRRTGNLAVVTLVPALVYGMVFSLASWLPGG
ncbi:AzlD domain-containing protein [Thermodesulfobacteriota bacterium B35]